MSILLLALVEVAFIVWLLHAIEKRGYKKGHRDGYKDGYHQGLLDAKKWSDLWWEAAEREVTRTQETIRNEEGWP